MMRGIKPVRHWGTWLLAATLLAAGCGSEDSRPDIILVTFDTTRADRLGCYGYRVADTPNIDAFARQAVLFENAVTAVPVTSPAHASMMTGLSPLRHGVRNNGSFVLREQHTTLAERLRARGYRTAAFVSAFVLHRQFGLSQGFDFYDDDLVNERSAAETTRRAVAWLQEAGAEPVFLWVHYFDPHTPWAPIEPFASRTRGTAYDAEISAMDAAFGELLGALRAGGRFDPAHILVVGDHGEGLEDHGELEHGVFLYEECLRIPFIWKTPGQRATGRQSGLVGTVDLLPTLLELSGTQGPAPEEIDGLSLAAVARGGGVPDREGLYAETLFPYYNFEWCPLFAWRTGGQKFVEAPRAELYDLKADPAERRNLLEGDPGGGHLMRKRLRNYRLRYGTESGLPPEEVLSPEVEERLRSLGYIWSAGHDEKAPFDSLPDPKDMISSHALYEAAKTAAELGNWPEAIEGLEAVLAETPRNATAILALGHVLVEAGRAQEAIPWLERHLELRPNNAMTFETLGDAYAILKRWEEALEVYGRAEWNQGAARSLAKKRAMIYARQGRFDEARESFRQGRAADEGGTGIWDRWIEAADQIQRWGTERAAATPREWVAQVKAAAALERNEEALRLCDQGRHFGERRFWGLRAELAMAAADWQAARTALGQVAEQDSASERLYLSLMLVNLNLADLPGALQAGREGTKRVADEGGRLHYNLACVEARLGHTEAGLDALDEALQRGYRNVRNLEEDPELASLRDDPRFEETLSQAKRLAGDGATNRP